MLYIARLLMVGLFWIVLLGLSLIIGEDRSTLHAATDTAIQPQFTIPSIPQPPGSTITVTVTTDDLEVNGNCTLREAVQAANTDSAVDACPAGSGHDLILLSALTLDPLTYELSLPGRCEDENVTGDLDILDDLTIATARTAQSVVPSVINAQGIDRVLHVHEGVSVTLYGLDVMHGESTSWDNHCERANGGGIHNAGALLLVHSAVTSNYAGNADTETPGAHGGGIYNTSVLTVISSTVAQNRAGTGGDMGYAGGMGGGIANDGGRLTVQASTISGNSAGAAGSVPKGYALKGGDGGGIFSSGVLTITDSKISMNSTADSGDGGGIANLGIGWIEHTEIGDNFTGFYGGAGGGIYNQGMLHLFNSAIHHNQTGEGVTYYVLPSPSPHIIPSGFGGGIRNQGTLVAQNITISTNRTGRAAYDATIGNGAGIHSSGTTVLQFSTIAGNLTGAELDCINLDCSDGGAGGGIYVSDAGVTLRSVLFADNLAASAPDCAGVLSSAGYNLIQNMRGCTLYSIAESDIINQYAWLAPLADNGGATPSHALLPQSSALDNGACTTIEGATVTLDQRGQPRPQGANCDIGAFESDLSPIPAETLYLVQIAK